MPTSQENFTSIVDANFVVCLFGGGGGGRNRVNYGQLENKEFKGTTSLAISCWDMCKNP